MHEAGGQLVVVVEGAPLVHPSPEDAFVDAQALTPSIDEGVQPKIKTAPRRASPTRFVVDSSSTSTLYGLPFLQGPMEDLVLILGQKARDGGVSLPHPTPPLMSRDALPLVQQEVISVTEGMGGIPPTPGSTPTSRDALPLVDDDLMLVSDW